MKAGIALGLVLLFWQWQATADVNYSEREDVLAYVSETAAEHGFDEAKLLALFGEVERKQSILDAISRPAERAKRWDEYRAIFVTESRTRLGVEFWDENEEVLREAEETFGVPPEIIVAIIGVETRYGRNMGSFRVPDALVTLGFDYPKRAKFFRKEFTEFLLLAREEGMDPLSLKGSYAGAMGYGQFIPSSFRAYSVDFDGDGVRDIWTNKRDAIGSVANYFKVHGWRGDGPLILPATLTDSAADALANDGLKLKHTVGSLQAAGVAVTGAPADTPATLFRLQLEDGVEYFVALHDFYVITRYNHSHMYALAVSQLADAVLAARRSAIAAAAAPVTSSP